MTGKQPKKRVSANRAAKEPCREVVDAPVVLVGTYRPEQLEGWILPQGFYNYPVGKRDSAIFKDAPRVSELWLYAGKAGKRRFSAKLENRITAAELDAMGYPRGMGRHHGKEYLLFRVEEIPRGGADARRGAGRSPGEPRVLVRLEDFEHDEEVLKAKLAKLFGGAEGEKASAPEKPFSYLDCLPDDLVEEWGGNLCVCEAAEQLTFWPRFDEGGPARQLSSRNVCDNGDEAGNGGLPGKPEVSTDVAVASNPRFRGWVAPSGIRCFFATRTGTLFLGDSLEWLKSLPDCCVDMVFADPPYGIGKADWDVFSDEAAYLSWCDKWVGEVARILTPHGSCYICGFSEILADVKFRVARHFKACRWLVWHYRNKANLGMDWGRSHESILHFRKSPSVTLNVDDVRIPYGAHTLKYPARTQAETSAFSKSASGKKDAWTPNPLGAKPKDVFDIPTTCNGMGEKTPHPTQKPEELLRKLVLASSNPGDWVLDPFSGSGTTLVVSEQLGRNWLGCDLSAEYNGWAKQRLSNVPSRSVRDWIDLDRETATRRDSIR